MQQIPVGRLLFGAIAACLIVGPALAEGPNAPVGGYGRHASRLPPETRYRDPRYVPSRRPPVRYAQPDFLINAYLPRNTEAPMYNEPPARFPGR